MENFNILNKALTCISFLLLSFLLSVLSQNSSQSSVLAKHPLAPVSGQSLIFKDKRLAAVYPVIQAFKGTITEDPLNRTGTWVGSDICNYTGFFCDNPPDNSSAIALAGIDFNGFLLAAPTLGGFIDNLPDLAIFHANSNKFSGFVPDVSRLPYFYELDLSNNVFSGAFPTTVVGVKELSFLDIRFNFFAGTVPPQIFEKPLDFLFINNNDFRAKLPDNFGSTRARVLTLANNQITGTIPRSIRNLNETLTEVLLSNNNISGCLPYELGFLKELEVFDIENNLLTGPLPSSLACLEKIELLSFSNNQLYWEVPEELCALALGKVVNFSLSDNYFTKVGPVCRKLIRIGALNVRHNCIRDLADQKSVKDCAEFYLKYFRLCPYPATYKIIPCRPNALRREHWARTFKKAPVPYKTLSRHKF